MASLRGFGKSLGGGYSTQLASDLVGESELVAVGAGLVPHYAWDEKLSRYTDDLSSYSLAVSAKGCQPFEVKLPADASFDGDFLSHVVFEGLEACQVRGQVYFKAHSVKVVK